jgi:hypothetical protein
LEASRQVKSVVSVSERPNISGLPDESKDATRHEGPLACAAAGTLSLERDTLLSYWSFRPNLAGLETSATTGALGRLQWPHDDLDGAVRQEEASPNGVGEQLAQEPAPAEDEATCLSIVAATPLT